VAKRRAQFRVFVPLCAVLVRHRNSAFPAYASFIFMHVCAGQTTQHQDEQGHKKGEEAHLGKNRTLSNTAAIPLISVHNVCPRLEAAIVCAVFRKGGANPVSLITCYAEFATTCDFLHMADLQIFTDDHNKPFPFPAVGHSLRASGQNYPTCGNRPVV
jgi:hypothetical protein